MTLLSQLSEKPVRISEQSKMKENTVLRVADTFCALAKLGDSVPLPNASQRYKLRMFTMKESSFPSCDLLRECKHGSLADK